MGVRSAARIGLALLLVMVAACGSSAGGTTTTAANGTTASPGAVVIDNFAFMPSTLTVEVGSAVTWMNEQGVDHTVTADDNSFDSGPMARGAGFQRTFDAAGTFAYHCTIHPSMTATITVGG